MFNAWESELFIMVVWTIFIGILIFLLARESGDNLKLKEENKTLRQKLGR